MSQVAATLSKLLRRLLFAQPQLCAHQFANFELLDFAGYRLWKAVYKLDVLGHFKVSEAGFAEQADFFALGGAAIF